MNKQLMWEYVQLHKDEVERFCVENKIAFDRIWSSPKTYNHEVIYFQDKFVNVPATKSTPPALIVTRQGDDLRFEIFNTISPEYSL